MPAMVTLCPDAVVPLAVCDECKALVRAREIEAHEAWHAAQHRPGVQPPD